MERRFWLGIGILAVFLALSLWTANAMTHIHEPISQTLEQAAQAALSGDMDKGNALAADAKAAWDRHWHPTAALADHAPMEEIDALFSQLNVYGTSQDSAHFAADCAELSRLIEAMGDAHVLNWWNLL